MCIGLAVYGTTFSIGLHPASGRPVIRPQPLMDQAVAAGLLRGVELPATLLEGEDSAAIARYAREHSLFITLATSGYEPEKLAAAIALAAQLGATTVRTVVGGAKIGGDRRPLAGNAIQIRRRSRCAILEVSMKKVHLVAQRRPSMPFKLQQIPEESKLSYALRLPLLEQYYPREVVAELLSQCHAWEERERKLSQLLIVYYVIALSLFRQYNVTEVFAHLCRALRWLWPDPELDLPTGGALTARRQSLGVTVMRLLFRRSCRPLATEATKGAFALGLRLMAIDGTLDEVPDTAANACHFGRINSGPNQSAYPQVRCLYLLEAGTHAIIDAVAARCKASEQALSRCLLRSITAGMLLMSDRNFFSVNWIASVQQQGAQVLCRLAAGMFTQPSRILSDGSYLVNLPRKGQELLTVRVIEYDLHPQVAAELALLPPSRSARQAKPGQKHRLLTTLLDPQTAPALELIQLYHERWEIELSIDEIKIHQRLCPKPLRSKSPELLYQEFYGLLLAHYALHACMHEPACQAGLDPDRLSFTHALHVLDTACYEFALVRASELPRLRQRLLADLAEAKYLLAPRRLRFCPRVVKRPFSNFRRKHPWHLCSHFKGYRFTDLLLI